MKIKYKVFSVRAAEAMVDAKVGATTVKAKVPVTVVQLVPVEGSHGTIKLELMEKPSMVEGAVIEVAFGA